MNCKGEFMDEIYKHKKIKTLEDLFKISTGNFQKVIQDLLDWYGNKNIEYFSKKSFHMSKVNIQIIIEINGKYCSEIDHTWDFDYPKKASYVLRTHKTNVIVFGYSII